MQSAFGNNGHGCPHKVIFTSVSLCLCISASSAPLLSYGNGVEHAWLGNPYCERQQIHGKSVMYGSRTTDPRRGGEPAERGLRALERQGQDCIMCSSWFPFLEAVAGDNEKGRRERCVRVEMAALTRWRKTLYFVFTEQLQGWQHCYLGFEWALVLMRIWSGGG